MFIIIIIINVVVVWLYIVSAYAPPMANPKENKEAIYSHLNGTLRNIPRIGDFNAMIGR